MSILKLNCSQEATMRNKNFSTKLFIVKLVLENLNRVFYEYSHSWVGLRDFYKVLFYTLKTNLKTLRFGWRGIIINNLLMCIY